MAMTAKGISDRIYDILLASGYGSVSAPQQGTQTGQQSSLTTLRHLCDAIGTGVFTEITQNARATGVDSNADSHSLSIV